MPDTKSPGTGQNITDERGGNQEKQTGQQRHGGTTQKSGPGNSRHGDSREQHVAADEQSHKNS